MAACMRLLTDSFDKRIVDKKTRQQLIKIPIFFPVLAVPVAAGVSFL